MLVMSEFYMFNSEFAEYLSPTLIKVILQSCAFHWPFRNFPSVYLQHDMERPVFNSTSISFFEEVLQQAMVEYSSLTILAKRLATATDNPGRRCVALTGTFTPANFLFISQGDEHGKVTNA